MDMESHPNSVYERVHSDMNVRTDQERLDKMKEIIYDEYLDDQIPEVSEQSLSLIKIRSERKLNKSILQELEEDSYNTHFDELQRRKQMLNWSDIKRKLYENLDSLVDYHVEQVVAHVFHEKELQEIFQNDEREDAEKIWNERFLEYAIKAIRLVKPSTRLMKDTMDINNYIKIELIEHEDDSKCKYINGCVLKNNIADRRMRSEIENPRILLIGNSVGFCQEDSCADLETYVRQENHYIDILMDRINQVNPDVIIVEKEISRSVLAKIRALNITVITNVKRKSIEKIARCTETIIIPSINLIEKHISLGMCKKFYVKLGTVKLIKDESKIMTINQSLIYFDGCKPWYGSTICLSGPNDRYLVTMKKHIKKVLKYCRDIVLEKEYLFMSDGDTKDRVESPYLITKVPTGKTYFKYVQVLIRQGMKDDVNNSNYFDENNEHGSMDNKDDNNFGENEAQVKKNMHQICGKPEKKNIEVYSCHDITLGGFLRKTAYEALEKCDFCREKMYKHITDIYHGEGYIEISVSIKDHHKFLQRQDEREHEKNKKLRARENLHNKVGDYTNDGNSGSITMYEECKNCRSFNKNMKTINSELQEYSFTKFLEQYFFNQSIVVQNSEELIHETAKEDESSSSDNESKDSESSCEHKIHRDMIRTFVLSGIKIKIKYKKIDTYSIDIVKFRDIDNSGYQIKIANEEFD